MDRKAELQRKKEKLAAIKARKEQERQKLMESGGGSGAGKSEPLDPDELIKSLGISAQPTPSSERGPSPSTPASDGGMSPLVGASPKRQRKALSHSKISQTTIAPRELVQYCKETQTLTEQHERDARSVDYYVLAYDESERDDHMDANTAIAELQKMPHVSLVPAAKTIDDEKEEHKEVPQVRELSEEEKADVMMSEEFTRAFTRMSRIMERALSEEMPDIMTDYSGADREEDEGDSQSRQLLKLNREFFDERWSRHRVVTCMDWSAIFPELLVASYNTNEEAPHEPDGVCLVWNVKYKKTTPEYIFHCQSPVMSTSFAKFHPNLLVGGTYSGQIVLWDNRNNKRTPVQRTPLSAAAHTHPVYCLTVAGTQNAHNLISVSTDGKLCSWSLDMLSQPQESIELQHRQTKSVAVTCFSFLANEVNNFVVGAEEGAVYSGCRHGSKAGVSEIFEGHQAPVTGIDTHNIPGPIDFSHLFITSSMDWTVKLWSTRDSRPLYSFEDNSGYVYDAAWSPLHPAMFAAVDGSGRLDVWKLNLDQEVPKARVQMEGSAPVALNKVRWHSTGLHIAAGDDLGRIHIYDLNEHFAQPSSSEWSMLASTIQELKSTSADQREIDDSAISGSMPMR